MLVYRKISWMDGYEMISTLNSLFFFFNDTATTEIYTLSLHDALPISRSAGIVCDDAAADYASGGAATFRALETRDRKSTRLNSSHSQISYAVFCLKKKKRTGLGVYTTRITRAVTPSKS